MIRRALLSVVFTVSLAAAAAAQTPADIPSAASDAIPPAGADGETTRIDRLFADLARAATDEEAQFIADEIEALWSAAAGPTAELLTARAREAYGAGDLALAREIADGLVEIAPDYADGWGASAEIAFAADDIARAMEDVARAVDIEPRHYPSLFGLGVMLESLERWSGAYEVYEQVLALYPRHVDARDRAQDIEARARGRDL